MAQIFELMGDVSGGAGQTAGGRVSERAASSRRDTQLFSRALLALGMAALWGLAAGAKVPMMALANIYKVPMVLALSGLVAAPAVAVTRHLLRLELAPRDLADAGVNSLFRGALVLVGFAPLLAVYAYTSVHAAHWLAQLSALLALATALWSFRHELSRFEAPRRDLAILGFVSAVTVCLVLLQLISLAAPVLTMPTVFRAGIDGMLR
jgi:hypothetical protein